MRTLLLSLLLLTSLVGQGQDTAVVDLRKEGVNFLNCDMDLSQVYSTAKAKTELEYLFGWGKYIGMTEPEIMTFSFAEAVARNGFWKGENGNYSSPAPAHAWKFIFGEGKHRATGSLPVGSGIYEGQSSRFHDKNGMHTYGGTEWYIDHARWKDKYWPDRIIFKSANWGSDGDGAWVHHVVIRDIYFNGMKRTPWLVNDGKVKALVALWDAAEAMSVERCYFADSEGDGLLFARGTPARSFNCSFFRNNGYGQACMGNGKFAAIGASGDENGIALIGGGPAFGRPGNGQLTIIDFKHEVSTSGPFRPWKGRPMLSVTGGWCVTIVGGTYASANGCYPYSFVEVDPSLGISSSIEWSGVQFFGNSPKCILYDKVKNIEYGYVGDAFNTAMNEGLWHKDYGLKNRCVTIPTSTGKGGSLQHVGPDGATSWATAGLYDPTGGTTAPPPPNPTPCTYTTGAWSQWSTCTNGTQTRTRTVTATPSGCTGTPPASSESQSCTVTPPPPTGTIAHYTFNSGTTANITATVGANMTQSTSWLRFTSLSGGQVSNSRASATYPVNWSGVTTITLTGLKWTGTPNYQMILGNAQGKGLIVLPDGKIVDNTSGIDADVVPTGSVKPGTPVDLVLRLNDPVDVTFFGARPGAGNCWIGSLDELKVQ